MGVDSLGSLLDPAQLTHVRDLNCVSNIPLKVIIQSEQQHTQQIMVAARRTTTMIVSPVLHVSEEQPTSYIQLI